MSALPRRLAVTGRGLWATRTLPALLDDCTLVRVAGPAFAAPAVDGVLAWGRRPSAQRAAAFASRRGLPLVTVEDGFLRSVGLGADEPPLSLVVDDLGIYYDASAPSRLEALVALPPGAEDMARARALRAAWCAAGVSKYNAAPEPASLPARYVLVIDQTAGDASITGGLADATSFTRMLAAALAAYPDSTVLLKVHPDVVAGRKRGHFDLAALAREPRVQVLADAVHPATLVARAEAVYTVTSQVGFEALLHGRPVHVFGMPFYAGWGLTQDALPPPARRRPVPLEQLVHAALVAYPRYVDPETGRRCEVEQLLAWMALQRRERTRFPAPLHAFRLRRKRRVLQHFLAGHALRFVHATHNLPAGATVAVWGRPDDGLLPAEARVLRVEDGFLRSVGLGAGLVRPLSLVFDDAGIYFDATRPSRLEHLLQAGGFDADLLARAAQLRGDLCATGITKYNLGGSAWQRPAGVARVILVPGQVETDASIRWGAPGLRRNIDLLRAVRAENPDAWVVYKPHPDVVAGLRRAGSDEAQAVQFCDEVVTAAPMQALLDAVDDVHVLTSLAGFEALLRGRRVVCWGQPFYAGWGLTDDRQPLARRTRRCTLDELVAATLILYPTYVSSVTGAYTTPERALVELAAWRTRGGSRGAGAGLLRVLMRLRALLLRR